MSKQPKITPRYLQDGKIFIASCPQFPEANGQGLTKETARESLYAAIEAIQAHNKDRSKYGY